MKLPSKVWVTEGWHILAEKDAAEFEAEQWSPHLKITECRVVPEALFQEWLAIASQFQTQRRLDETLTAGHTLAQAILALVKGDEK